MKTIITFDESDWIQLEKFLPDDVFIKRVILDDFMWFVGRTKKYKTDKEKIDDYIKHLYLKANSKYEIGSDTTVAFKSLDIEKIRAQLINEKRIL